MSGNQKIKYRTMLLFGFLAFTYIGCTLFDNLGSYREKERVDRYSWRLLNSANVGYTNFVIIDHNSPNVVFAGPDVGGIYKSYDYGEHWIPSNRGLVWPVDRMPAALTIDSESGIIYLGVGGFGKGGMFKSTDHGESWQLLTRIVKFNGHGKFQARGQGLIVIDPTDEKIIYAGSHKDGIFKSIDGGESWFNIGLEGKYISSIVINPLNSREIYVAAVKGNKKEGGIYKSTDGGGSWKKLDNKVDDVYQLIMDTSNSDTLYAANGIHGIFKTTDGGMTWVKKNKGLSITRHLKNPRYISLAIDPKDNKTIYAGSGLYRGKIYKSINGGDQWVNLTNNNKNIHPDGWWIQKMNWPGGKVYSANSLSIDPKNSKRIFVSGRSGIWRSDDGGIKWKAKVNGFEGACMFGIAVHPRNPDIFFVGEADYKMFRTIDGGRTFDRPLKGIGNWDLEESRDIWLKYEKANTGLVFAIDPRNNPFTIYSGIKDHRANNGAIFKSTDGGDTWNEANNGLPNARVTAIAIDQTNYNTLFAILKGHGLYKTIDSGKSWKRVVINIGIENMFQWRHINYIIIHPEFSNIIYILDKKSGVYKTVNGGKNWELISHGLPRIGIKGMDDYVGGIAVDYKDPDILYLGLRNHGVYKTTNGGKRWKKITPPYIHHGGAISIDPFDNFIYFVSAPASGEEDIEGFIPGIYKSTDDGKNWYPIHNDDLLRISLKVRFLVAVQGKIYISTLGNGIIIGEPEK